MFQVENRNSLALMTGTDTESVVTHKTFRSASEMKCSLTNSDRFARQPAGAGKTGIIKTTYHMRVSGGAGRLPSSGLELPLGRRGWLLQHIKPSGQIGPE